MAANTQTATKITKFESFTYKWEIDNWLANFSNYETGKFIKSPLFKILDRPWNLFIYPNGVDAFSQGHISITLFGSLIDFTHTDARFAFSFATNENRIIANYDSMKKVGFSNNTTECVRKFASNSAVAECVRASPVDKIVVFCKLITQEDDSPQAPLDLCAHVAQHFQAFESFINNERFSDVKIKVDGREIFAHKIILSAHSPVFAAMFEHEMRENQDNVVTVDDVSYEVFYQLLRFMYLGKSDFVEETLGDLFKAADKYQLPKLKTFCEMELCRSMSVDNVFDCLGLADMHNAVDLKEKVTDFVVDHITEIINGPKLEVLKNLDSNLFREILQRLHSKGQS